MVLWNHPARSSAYSLESSYAVRLVKQFAYWPAAVASGAWFVLVGMECDVFVYKRNIEVMVQC
jgi:hypothetical protein